MGKGNYVEMNVRKAKGHADPIAWFGLMSFFGIWVSWGVFQGGDGLASGDRVREEMTDNGSFCAHTFNLYHPSAVHP